jgi:hypothetical protein
MQLPDQVVVVEVKFEPFYMDFRPVIICWYIIITCIIKSYSNYILIYDIENWYIIIYKVRIILKKYS